MAADNQPNGLAAGGGAGGIFVARATRRDPGRYGLGRHPPLPVPPPRCLSRLPVSSQPETLANLPFQCASNAPSGASLLSESICLSLRRDAARICLSWNTKKNKALQRPTSSPTMMINSRCGRSALAAKSANCTRLTGDLPPKEVTRKVARRLLVIQAFVTHISVVQRQTVATGRKHAATFAHSTLASIELVERHL